MGRAAAADHHPEPLLAICMTAQAVGLCRLPVTAPVGCAAVSVFCHPPSRYSLLFVPATPDAIQKAQ
ncbi:hypothetical protein AERO9A_350036 [Aeromonas salmonicida]|nr:hypothetical protein AERO9A_350036 [Aeromonas salmonicida]